ncbi:MAG: OmpH family outer membrane protein [Henriciella sp.]|nr:OmpH family outer membrane protein [Henriciella sp.]
MFSIKPMLAAFAFSLGTVAVSAPIATAQGTTVIVIDQGKIMQDSKAGKDIQAKLKGIGSSIERELKPTADQLNTESKSIEAQTANMTPQAMRADAALKTKVETYARKAQDFNRRRQIASGELQLTERKAWSDFYVALRPVLQEVVTEKGAQLMVDRAEAVYTDPSIDVTALVISKMDAKTPTISVVRQKMPTQPAR